MLNRRFNDAVRQRLINIQAAEARAAREGLTVSAAPAYHPDAVAAFVDLQNLHYFLKENCRLPATQVHLPRLLRDWSRAHDLPLTELHIFTGIHDRRREPQRHDSVANRVRWLQREGCFVTTLPLSYYPVKGTGEVRAQEKGIDVRIGAEILRAVNGGLRRALVITQDKDISQAVKVAGEMAAERGTDFRAFSMTLVGTDWEHNGKCGMCGVAYTDKLPIDIDFIQGYVREERPRTEAAPVADTAEA